MQNLIEPKKIALNAVAYSNLEKITKLITLNGLISPFLILVI